MRTTGLYDLDLLKNRRLNYGPVIKPYFSPKELVSAAAKVTQFLVAPHILFLASHIYVSHQRMDLSIPPPSSVRDFMMYPDAKPQHRFQSETLHCSSDYVGIGSSCRVNPSLGRMSPSRDLRRTLGPAGLDMERLEGIVLAQQQSGLKYRVYIY